MALCKSLLLSKAVLSASTAPFPLQVICYCCNFLLPRGGKCTLDFYFLYCNYFSSEMMLLLVYEIVRMSKSAFGGPCFIVFRSALTRSIVFVTASLKLVFLINILVSVTG